MPQNYPLNEVLRPWDSSQGEPELKHYQKKKIYHPRRDAFLDKRPLFGSVQEYVVSFDQTVECQGPSCSVRSPRTQRRIELQIDYDVRCQRGQEEKAIRYLHDGDHPGHLLDDLLVQKLQEHSHELERRGEDLVLSFDELRSDVETRIEYEIEEIVGLTVKLRIQPNTAGKLETRPVNLETFQVRPSDSDKYIHMECVTDVEVDPDQRMLALLYYSDLKDIHKTIKKMLVEAFAGEVTLDDISTPQAKRLTRERLIERINSKLSRQGRRVRFLQLDTVVDSPAESALEIEHTVECNIRGYDDRIPARHRLILTLESAGRFASSEIGNLDAWIREKLDIITKDVFIEMRYVQLLLKFDPENPKPIRQRLESEVREIGYSVKSIMTLPGLEPIDVWKRGFTFEVHEEEFATQDYRVKVGLEVIVTGKIEELDHPNLKRYLYPQSGLFDDMKVAVRETVQNKLHEIPPELFYFCFTHSNHGQPVREMLAQSVADDLEKRFCVVNAHVIPKHLETEMTRRFAFLQNGPHKVDVEITSVASDDEGDTARMFPLSGSGEVEPVHYHIRFNVVNISENGWHVFCARNYESVEEEMKRLKEAVSDEAKARLSPIPYRVLAYRSGVEQMGIQKTLDTAKPNIRAAFGLEIDFIQMWRDKTESEIANQDVLKESIKRKRDTSIQMDVLESTNVIEKLEILQEEEKKLLAGEIDPEDEALENIRGQIDKLRQENLPFPNKGGDRGRKPKTLGSGGFSFDEYNKSLLKDASERGRLSQSEQHLLTQGKVVEES